MRVITHDANIMPQLVIGLTLVFSCPENEITRFGAFDLRPNTSVGLGHDTSLAL